MSPMRAINLTILYLAGLAWALPSYAGEPKQDSLGDPLPPGCVARLGTVRWRPDGRLAQVAFSADGKMIATGCGGDSTTVSIWDMATGKELARCVGHQKSTGATERVTGLVFSPDSRWLASGSSESKLRIWDAKTGKERWQIPGVWFTRSNCSFSPDSKFVAVLTREYSRDDAKDLSNEEQVRRLKSKILLWSLATGKVEKTIECPACSIASVAFAPDGRTLITAHDEEANIIPRLGEMPPLASLRTWDVATGKQLAAWGTRAYNTMMVVTPDGKTAITGSYEKMIHFWNLETGQLGRTLLAAGKSGDGAKSTYVYLALSGDGKTLVSSCSDETAIVWDVPSGKIRRLLENPCYPWNFAISPDGRLLVVAGGDSVNRLDLTNNQLLPGPVGHSHGVLSLSISADGQTLASADSMEIRRWSVPQGKFLGHVPGAGCVVYSPEGKWLAAGTHDEQLVLHDLTGKDKTHRVAASSPYLRYLTCAAFSANGRFVAAEKGYGLQIWETATGKLAPLYAALDDDQRYKVRTHANRLNSIAFSPDGKRLAWAGYSGLDIWQFPPKHALSHLKLIHATCVAFSPDGRFLASAAGRFLGESQNPRSLRLWNVDSGADALLFTDDPGNVVSLAFSADGRMLATGGSDGSVRLWELATGKQRGRFDGHCRKVTCLAFFPDGRLLASGSEDTTILLWRVGPELPAPADAEPNDLKTCRSLEPRLANPVSGQAHPR
jgi:WD40 repeat protein